MLPRTPCSMYLLSITTDTCESHTGPVLPHFIHVSVCKYNGTCSLQHTGTDGLKGVQVVANLGQEFIQLGGGEVAATIDDYVVLIDEIELPFFDEVPGMLCNPHVLPPRLFMCLGLRGMQYKPADRLLTPIVPRT